MVHRPDGCRLRAGPGAAAAGEPVCGGQHRHGDLVPDGAGEPFPGGGGAGEPLPVRGVLLLPGRGVPAGVQQGGGLAGGAAPRVFHRGGGALSKRTDQGSGHPPGPLLRAGLLCALWLGGRGLGPGNHPRGRGRPDQPERDDAGGGGPAPAAGAGGGGGLRRGPAGLPAPGPDGRHRLSHPGGQRPLRQDPGGEGGQRVHPAGGDLQPDAPAAGGVVPGGGTVRLRRLPRAAHPGVGDFGGLRVRGEVRRDPGGAPGDAGDDPQAGPRRWRSSSGSC